MKKKAGGIKLGVLEAGLWVYCILLCLPLVLILLNAFKTNREILIHPNTLPDSLALDNFIEAWKLMKFERVFFNSIFVTAVTVIFVVIISSMAGYKLARVKTKFSGVLFALFTLSLMVPFHSIMISLARSAKYFHLNDNLLSMTLIYGGYSCSLAIMLYNGFTKGIPYEVEESAMIDGCKGLRLFFTIVFPLLKTVTGTVAVIYALIYWNDIMLQLILISKRTLYTIPKSQMVFYDEFSGGKWNLVLAAAVISSIPVLIFYSFMQRYIISGITAGAVKG